MSGTCGYCRGETLSPCRCVEVKSTLLDAHGIFSSGSTTPRVWENAQWFQWPGATPHPTREQFEEAEKRYQTTLEHGDMTDYSSGLPFVMATYNRWIWWKFFFPEEGADLQKDALVELSTILQRWS